VVGGTLVTMVGSESPLLWWYGFPIAFALTCAIELPAYLGAFASLGWCRRGALTGRSALGLALTANLISHPLLWALSLGLAETTHLAQVYQWVGPGRPLRSGRLGLALIQIVTTIKIPRPKNPPTM